MNQPIPYRRWKAVTPALAARSNASPVCPKCGGPKTVGRALCRACFANVSDEVYLTLNAAPAASEDFIMALGLAVGRKWRVPKMPRRSRRRRRRAAAAEARR